MGSLKADFLSMPASCQDKNFRHCSIAQSFPRHGVLFCCWPLTSGAFMAMRKGGRFENCRQSRWKPAKVCERLRSNVYSLLRGQLDSPILAVIFIATAMRPDCALQSFNRALMLTPGCLHSSSAYA